MKKEQIDALTEALKYNQIAKESEGYIKFRNILRIRFSYLIFLDNMVSLNRTFKEFQKLDSFFESGFPKIQRRLIKELYNLISSAENLKEHLRAEKVANLIEDRNDIHRHFFRELRNYLVHHGTFSLISKHNLYKSESGETITEKFQSMGKEKFIAHLETRIKIFKIPKEIKHKKRTLKVLEYVRDLPMDFNFEILLSQYNKSIQTAYQTRMCTYVKKNFQPLLDFSLIVTKVHKSVKNLPIDILQARYLRYILTISTSK